MEHQARDDYWRHGSIREDYGALDCAVLAVGGWADAYVDAIFRMMENLSVPRRALIGPWGHHWPQYGRPGPEVGFLQEAVRWWDHWLKGIDTGVMEEPMVRAWMQEAVHPGPRLRRAPRPLDRRAVTAGRFGDAAAVCISAPAGLSDAPGPEPDAALALQPARGRRAGGCLVRLRPPGRHAD